MKYTFKRYKKEPEPVKTEEPQQVIKEVEPYIVQNDASPEIPTVFFLGIFILGALFLAFDDE